MRKAIPEAARDKPVEIWFQDEARVGQQGTLTRLWARCGTRPRVVRDTRYEWAYLFGAVCPARAVGAALVAHSTEDGRVFHVIVGTRSTASWAAIPREGGQLV